MLIDLHTHTRPLSWDSDLGPDELIELSRKAGLDGICLTEHDYFWDAAAVRRLAKKHDFLVLPAVEINTEQGHILCFGLDRYIYGMHRWPELARHVERAGGAMVAAHPYRRQMPWRPEREADYSEALAGASCNPAYAGCVALERVNGRGSGEENAFAARICDRLAMAGTASSDAHEVADIGRCATEFLAAIESLEDLIRELKAGRFRAVRLDGGADSPRPANV